MAFGKQIWRGFWMGVWMGFWVSAGAVPPEECNVSVYKNSAGEDVFIDFVDDGSGNFVPATGPMHFVQDYLKASFATIDIADGADRFLRGKIKLDMSLNSTVMIHNYTGADNVSPSCRLQYEVGNGIRGLWFDDTNTLKGTTDWIPVALDVELVYNFIFNSSSTMNLTINGVSGVPRSATAGGACNVFAEYVGSYSATLFRAPLHMYECDSCIVGFSNTVNRLPAQDAVSPNVIPTTTEVDRILTDNAPFGIFFPWDTGAFNAVTGAFLVEDRHQIGSECVPVPAGFELATDANGDYYRDPFTQQFGVRKIAV